MNHKICWRKDPTSLSSCPFTWGLRCVLTIPISSVCSRALESGAEGPGASGLGWSAGCLGLPASRACSAQVSATSSNRTMFLEGQSMLTAQREEGLRTEDLGAPPLIPRVKTIPQASKHLLFTPRMWAAHLLLINDQNPFHRRY